MALDLLDKRPGSRLLEDEKRLAMDDIYEKLNNSINSFSSSSKRQALRRRILSEDEDMAALKKREAQERKQMRIDIYEHVKRQRQLRKLKAARQKLIGEKVQEVEDEVEELITARLGHVRCLKPKEYKEDPAEKAENIRQRLAALEMKQHEFEEMKKKNFALMKQKIEKVQAGHN